MKLSCNVPGEESSCEWFKTQSVDHCLECSHVKLEGSSWLETYNEEDECWAKELQKIKNNKSLSPAERAEEIEVLHFNRQLCNYIKRTEK